MLTRHNSELKQSTLFANEAVQARSPPARLFVHLQTGHLASPEAASSSRSVPVKGQNMNSRPDAIVIVQTIGLSLFVLGQHQSLTSAQNLRVRRNASTCDITSCRR